MFLHTYTHCCVIIRGVPKGNGWGRTEGIQNFQTEKLPISRAGQPIFFCRFKLEKHAKKLKFSTRRQFSNFWRAPLSSRHALGHSETIQGSGVQLEHKYISSIENKLITQIGNQFHILHVGPTHRTPILHNIQYLTIVFCYSVYHTSKAHNI